MKNTNYLSEYSADELKTVKIKILVEVLKLASVPRKTKWAMKIRNNKIENLEAKIDEINAELSSRKN